MHYILFDTVGGCDLYDSNKLTLYKYSLCHLCKFTHTPFNNKHYISNICTDTNEEYISTF